MLSVEFLGPYGLLVGAYLLLWVLEMFSDRILLRKWFAIILFGYHFSFLFKLWYGLGLSNPPWISASGFGFLVSGLLLGVHIYFAYLREELWPRRFQAFFMLGLMIPVVYKLVQDQLHPSVPLVTPGNLWITWLYLLAMCVTFAYANLVCRIAFMVRRQESFDSVARILSHFTFASLSGALVLFGVWQTNNFGMYWNWGAPIETVFLMAWLILAVSYQWRRLYPSAWTFSTISSGFVVALLIFGFRFVWIQ